MFEENTSFTSDKTSAEACDVRGLPKLSIGESFCRRTSDDRSRMSIIVLFTTEAIKCTRGGDCSVSLITVQSVYLFLAMFLSRSALALTPVAPEGARDVTHRKPVPLENLEPRWRHVVFYPWKIYILLYSSSIVCNVRIHVVDVRRGDFSQLQNS